MRIKDCFVLIYVSILVVMFIGCGAIKSERNIPLSSDSRSEQSIPPSSPFAKIKEGMGEKQVQDLIGMQNDIRVFNTGKMWNPFYFGSDLFHTVYYYKGMGRITFGGNGRVVKIDYDPTEDGYK